MGHRGYAGSASSRSRAAEPPAAWCDLGEAHEDVLEERLELDLRHRQEVRMIRLREQEQPLDDALDPAELVERDVDLAGARPAPPQHLEVAARDRHRRAQ